VLSAGVSSPVFPRAVNSYPQGNSPLPRRKTSRSIIPFLPRSFTRNIIREIKTIFSSNIEVSILKLTAPSPYLEHYASFYPELLQTIEDNPNDSLLIATIMSKISRKMTENNMFTKLKSLFLIHKLLVDTKEEVAATLVTYLDMNEGKNGKVFHFLNMQPNHLHHLNPESVAEIEMIAFLNKYEEMVSGSVRRLLLASDGKQSANSLVRNDNSKKLAAFIQQYDNAVESKKGENAVGVLKTYRHPIVEACIDLTKASLDL
jgi:hypothetical protein